MLADKIITSPPFAESTHHSDDPETQEKFRPGRTGSCAGTAGASKDNIGNLPYGNIDSIITSPPYEGSLQGETTEKMIARKREILESEGWTTKTSGLLRGIRANQSIKGFLAGYSNKDNNIGNLKSQSYLEAMLKVYQQCFKVLRPQGLMILVTKNFIRDQKEIRLDSDTIRLCEQAGFQFVERHYRKLTSQSFWRVIYKQKFPDAPVLDKEDVLVFKKVLL